MRNGGDTLKEVSTKKTIHQPGRLWGWPSREEEMEYVKRTKELLERFDCSLEIVTSHQSITYPELGMRCLQLEIWEKTEVVKGHDAI